MLLVNPVGSRVPFGRHNLSQHAVRAWARLFVFTFSLRVERTHHKDAMWPGIHALLVANHQSWQDIIVLLSMQPMCFVAKQEIRDWPVFGAMVAAAGTVFIRRGDMQSSGEVRDSMHDALQSSSNVAIFPEGGVPTTPGVARFHARLFAPAIDAMLPIQPLCLRYLINGKQSQRSRFRQHESFAASMLRLLAAPPQTVQVHVLPTIMPGHDLQRKTVASQAEQMIRRCYDPEAGRTEPHSEPATVV
jgi:1-acyl-sn-glycerol-3-phosphate acyltransferase